MSKGTIYNGNISISASFDEDNEYKGTLSVGGDLRAQKQGMFWRTPRVQVGGVYLGGGSKSATYGGQIPGKDAKERRKWLEDNGFIK